VGCGTVNPDPFGKFTISLQKVREGADEALKINDEANRERFINETAEASQTPRGSGAVQNLLIQGVEGEPFAWEMNKVPLFMTSPQFRSGVYTLNSTLIAYAELLSTLAGSDLVSQTEFDDLAKDLNAGLKSAAATLQLENSENISGIISAAASQAAFAYINNKRQSKLHEFLEQNQTLIVEISDKLQSAIRIAVRNLRQNYDEESQNLARQLAPNTSVKFKARKTTVTKLIQLNVEFLTRLRIMEALNNSYRSLPQAHAELMIAVDKPGHDLAAVKGLYENGKHLYDLYNDLKKESE
jgi:hypothetical protein